MQQIRPNAAGLACAAALLLLAQCAAAQTAPTQDTRVVPQCVWYPSFALCASAYGAVSSFLTRAPASGMVRVAFRMTAALEACAPRATRADCEAAPAGDGCAWNATAQPPGCALGQRATSELALRAAFDLIDLQSGGGPSPADEAAIQRMLECSRVVGKDSCAERPGGLCTARGGPLPPWASGSAQARRAYQKADCVPTEAGSVVGMLGPEEASQAGGGGSALFRLAALCGSRRDREACESAGSMTVSLERARLIREGKFDAALAIAAETAGAPSKSSVPARLAPLAEKADSADASALTPAGSRAPVASAMPAAKGGAVARGAALLPRCLGLVALLVAAFP
ncbi:hypothetical protein MNEG_8346 [Monoraphidium neglectum]|uniref:Uncharacterized protein n=1 Tax=Monoraphidium neglectum TaxID=145388 RepID=A0A0D2JK23_9CHLO|nr:hypothetical protein MNEG_8346 [Monoraphidium neglectum]KIY99617.1 hypothetical protein MNEG_8346 [Monoraphidium neglectum]|eukprot:XP_013898637.1 hypothetical protein MNEG_8346 [Monoraphidium neglectum]